ncbi:MAG: DUF2357 domain-containing protein [Deltaproteobacteria bacterium]|nr:DUF2357 domain-containing protein [Deltaproteobacteria bacterium]
MVPASARSLAAARPADPRHPWVLRALDAPATTDTWEPLDPTWEALPADNAPRASLRWDPDFVSEGVCALSLHEYGEYLLHTPREGRFLGPSAGLFAALEAGLWKLSPRGHAGALELRFAHGDRAPQRVWCEVRTRRVEHRSDWRAMLDELAEVTLDAALVPSAPTTARARPREREPVGPWERFAFLRHLERSGRLDEALEAITRRPITWLRAARRLVPRGRATRPRPEDLAGRPGDAPVPELLPETSLDVPENRFVQTVLTLLTEEALALCENAPDPSLRETARGLHRALEARRARSPFAALGPLRGPAPVGAAALQRRAGYRELLALWVALQGLRFHWGPEGEPLGLRDTPGVYERWCTLEVLRSLTPAWEPMARRVLRGERVLALAVEGAVVTLQVQRSHPRGEGSYTFAFRPDLTLTLGARSLHLDAKYQLDEDDLEGSAPRLALLKMHAYRDALEGAYGAFALYPGTAEVRFDAPSGGGLGALPLRPGGSAPQREAQREALRALVGRFLRG